MINENKYKELQKFILENFETTTNINDRLHSKDIINIARNNNFSFSDCKIAEVFKSLNLGKHRSHCNINSKVQSGYYFVIHKK